MADKKVMVIMGTRPEAIKLAPVVRELRERSSRLLTSVVSTGQHREMLDQTLGSFGIRSDHDLGIMSRGQTLDSIMSATLTGLHPLLTREAPDLVIVQGDTTTSFAGALAAFHQKIAVAHVEAGLRTNDKYSPFPEEMNRRLTSRLADLHFAPTEGARMNLLADGIDPSAILVTGNTCIDALHWTLSKLAVDAPTRDEERLILVTAHRRENHGEPMRRICSALLRLAEEHENLRFLFPVHPNPKVGEVVLPALGGHPRIELTEPLDYNDFVLAMNRAHLILSDSGGVQEEAPSLGKPVLVLRESTERPEGVEAGTLLLVGTDPDLICRETNRLLTDEAAYSRMSKARNPYGDGRAALRIVDAVEASWR